MLCTPLGEEVATDGTAATQVTDAPSTCTTSSSSLPSSSLTPATTTGQTNIKTQTATGAAATRTSTDEQDYASHGGGISGGAIAGIVVGSILGIAVVASAVWFVARRNRQQRARDMQQRTASSSPGGASGLSPNADVPGAMKLAELSPLTRADDHHKRTELPSSTDAYIHESADLLPSGNDATAQPTELAGAHENEVRYELGS